jgi:predicted nucleic acid-binding protein
MNLSRKSKMPDLVINTGPIISLTVAVGSLDFLQALYREILVPKEVFIELQAGGLDCSEFRAIRSCMVLVVAEGPVELSVLLNSQLDKGEASVIQNAVIHGISVVAIDEKMGRRIARLHQLRITGSIGILIKAAKAGLIPSLEACFERMHAHGIWISRDLQENALRALVE